MNQTMNSSKKPPLKMILLHGILDEKDKASKGGHKLA